MCSAPSSLYPLSLHDALPISELEPSVLARWLAARLLTERELHDRSLGHGSGRRAHHWNGAEGHAADHERRGRGDRKSTRLNSSHLGISYAVFCLKEKTKNR